MIWISFMRQPSLNQGIVQELDNGPWRNSTLWMARSGSSMPLRASCHARPTASLLQIHLEMMCWRLVLSLQPFRPLAIALIHVFSILFGFSLHFSNNILISRSSVCFDFVIAIAFQVRSSGRTLISPRSSPSED